MAHNRGRVKMRWGNETWLQTDLQGRIQKIFRQVQDISTIYLRRHHGWHRREICFENMGYNIVGKSPFRSYFWKDKDTTFKLFCVYVHTFYKNKICVLCLERWTNSINHNTRYCLKNCNSYEIVCICACFGVWEPRLRQSG